MRKNEFDGLLGRIKKDIDSHDIISFDIFDTLLLRPYVKPTDMFRHFEQFYDLEGFSQARVSAERQARKTHHNLEDITIDEIYDEIDDKFQAFKKSEMDFERQILQPNLEMKAVFDYARKKNKRIIVASDMYLPEKFLISVLKEKGFTGIEKIYISCELRKSKKRGGLYRYILEDLGVRGRQILHIGDDKIADKKRATESGIKSVLYPKVLERLLNENLRAKKFYDRHGNQLDASILLGLLTLEDNTPHYWQDFGYKYAGPVILGYMQWLGQQLKQDKISEVMFIARDGYTLEKVFNLLYPSGFQTHYFYAPRALNLAMNLNYDINCGLGEISGLHGLNTLLHYCQDKDDFLRQNTPQIHNTIEGIQFIEDHKDLFLKLAEREKRAYAAYFKQFHLKTKKIAMVDTCSVLLSAQKTVMVALPDKEIKGYYWFICSENPTDIAKYKTQTFQTTHKQEFVDWSMMEWFMTAPTPPAEKIENGRVIFKETSPNEARRMALYPDLSQGAINFAKKYRAVFGKYISDFACDTLIDWVNIMCKNATPVDKEHFISLQHAWDQEHSIWQPLPLPWFNEVKPNQKIRRLWLFGFIPFLKIKKTPYRWKVSLFHFIPFIGYKSRMENKTAYLFEIPVFQIKHKRHKTKLLLFKIIPIISIKKRN